jgi:hypothetical protein
VTATFAKPAAPPPLAPAGAPKPNKPTPSARQSLFDLDAPSTGRIDASEARASEPPEQNARASLFDLDAPTTTRIDAAAARRSGTVPQATVPQAPAAPKPAAAARRSGSVPQPTAAPATALKPSRPTAPGATALETTGAPSALAPDYRDPVHSLFDAQAPNLDDPDLGYGTDQGDTSLLDDVSSLDELSTSTSRSTAEISASLVQQALQTAALQAAQSATSTPQPSTSMPPEYFEASFDQSLEVPKALDTLESKRSRLASRYKAARAGLKVLGFLDLTEEERKETLGLFAEYDGRLKALATALPEVAKKDSSVLHRELTKEGADELERMLGRVEERLLALDEFASQEKFRARITKDKHAPKLLLRYARFLASRRFNVGYRRDRFEYLLTELLTIATSDGRLRLLPRDKASPVLLQVLSGAPQSTTAEADRDAAVAYLRESLERLATLTTHEQFFESGYFLDVHGYKVSMRDQITSPEFLYLSVAINVEIHNRIEGWIVAQEKLLKANQLPQEGKPRDALTGQLRAQEEAVQGVFGGFKHPRDRVSQQTAGRPAAAVKEAPRKEVRKQPAKQTSSAAADLAELARTQLTKMLIVSAVIVVSFSIVLYSTGTVQVTAPAATAIAGKDLKALSPLLISARIRNDDHKLTANLHRARWNKLSAIEKKAEADRLAQHLKQTYSLNSAEIYSYKTVAVVVEFGVARVITTP